MSQSPEPVEPNWVVRGGLATPRQPQAGSDEHRGARGLFGFSVQHQPGLTIEQLAAAGQFPHAQISVTTVEDLVAAATAAGYTVAVVRGPGKGVHCTVQVPDPLPDDLALALSQAFVARPNPARARRG